MKFSFFFFFLLYLSFILSYNREDQLYNFNIWASKYNIETYNIEIRSLPLFNHQLGIFSTNDINEGDLILEIPFDIMMNEDSLQDSPCLDIIPDNEYLTATNEMALYLLYEKQNPNSKWKEYIDILPKHIHTTLFFTEDELNELQYSTLVPNTQRRKSHSLQYYKLIKQWIEESNVWEGDIFSEYDWLWALSILWSRAFSIKINEKPMGSLVPMADMFNAFDPRKDELQVRAILEDDKLKYYAKVFIPSNTEILMPYGKYKQHCNAELLLDYGYVRTINDNDISCVSNPYYSKSFTNSDKKIELLQSVDLWRKEYCWTLSEFPHELVWVMRIISLSSNELEQFSSKKLQILISEFEKTADKKQPMNSIPFGITTEQSAINLAIKSIEKTLGKYPTTIKEDIELLQQQAQTPLSYSQYAAIIIRSSEKRILLQSIEYLEEYEYHISSVESLDILI